MNTKKMRKGCLIVLVLYVIFAFLFYWIAGDQLRFQEMETDSVHAEELVGETVQGMEIRQPFIAKSEELLSVSVKLSTYARENTSFFQVHVLDETGRALAQVEVSALALEDNGLQEFAFDQPIPVTPGGRYELILTSPDATPGNAVTAWYGSTVALARGEAALEIEEENRLSVDGEKLSGMLCYSLHGRSALWLGEVYWQLAAAFGLLLAGYAAYLIHAVRKQKNTLVLRMVSAFQRYGYLMRQLIARDFKTKYKRSILGVCWSLLNPLLTMLVQYIVFSTLFKSDIPKFPLYLLIGIVCFNFFSESTSMALQSIVGNTALITKVYVPKYIYPVSRVFSSTINLLLSLIPLLPVMLLTQAPLRPAIILLPFGLICLIAFSIGIGFILATLMVFFRDTQFLWGVVNMLWMYMTPIFYPVSIIPAQYMALYDCNPVYQIIRFIRILLIEGKSPEPGAYVICLISSFVPLLIGAVVFKKNQDKFVMNL